MRRTAPCLGLITTIITGCIGYEPAPADPGHLLDELERVRLEPLPAGIAPIGTSAIDASDGLSVLEAAAVAVHLNPALRARRAELGVARAQLVEAGLLPDPSVGWESMNVVADFVTDRKSTANSYLAGFNVQWDVPRPGELDAKEGVALGRVHETQASVLRAEWELVREVSLAYVRLAVAQASLAINAEQLTIAGQTVGFFERSRLAGAATAVQERIARVERDRMRSERLHLELEEAAARSTLLALMGLPPESPLLLQDAPRALNPEIPPGLDPRAISVEATSRRPDLRELQAQYQQAEQQLRLEVARQFPQITIGTGLAIQLPIFSRLNHPAIATARRARVAAGERLRAAVHDMRRDVFLAHGNLVRAEAQVTFNDSELAPGLEQTLRLTRAAIEAGEATPLEILAAQSQTIGTQLDFLAARQRRAEAWVELQAASGRLLPRTAAPEPLTDEPQEDDE